MEIPLDSPQANMAAEDGSFVAQIQPPKEPTRDRTQTRGGSCSQWGRIRAPTDPPGKVGLLANGLWRARLRVI